MVSEADPELYANERGVWRAHQRGRPFCIEWDEIYCISGFKQDGISNLYICIALEWKNGHFIELYHHWTGFDQVVAAITERLPGLAPDWFQAIARLEIADRPLEVWHHGNSNAKQVSE